MFVKHRLTIYFILLLVFSILFNQYFGYIGVNPIDTFFSFNAGYDVLNGYYPFKDYWTITGPFIDLVQSFFFKIFGVSWFSYVFHASIFNFFISIATFFTLKKFNLELNYCLLYSFLVAILSYPSAGTPYVDHHASYISIIGTFCFILAIKTKLKKYWFFLPILFGLAFLTKQAPTAQIFLIVVILSCIYFLFNFEITKIIYGIFGSLLITLIFLLFLYIGSIPLSSFIEQYILFPLSLGESRVDFLFPLEFNRIFLRFKLIHLSYLLLIFVVIKNVIKNYKYIISEEFLIISAIIASSLALIVHQLMTINGMFVFFIIPILCGFSHIYFDKYFNKKNYILYFLLTISIGSTLNYGYKYIGKRHFLDLDKISIEKAVDSKILSKKLSGLKWITILNPENPNQEIAELNEAIQIIKSDTRNKILATDYQFISVVHSFYDQSPNKYWYKHHVYPGKTGKYFDIYKKFFINKLVNNKIKVVYTIKPMWGEGDVLNDILDKNCYKEKKLTKILFSQVIEECSVLN